MGASNGAGGGTTGLAQMWRSVYKKAADAAEARFAAQLDDHVYQSHGRRALTIVVEGTGGGDGGDGGTTAEVTITTDASLTATEAPANTFALATRISADAGNALSLHANGLYSTDTTGGGTTDVTVTTDASLTATEAPANTFALAVRLSPDAGNALSLHANGLYGTDTTGGGGTGNTTMYTQTTAPAGAANSLWFNPSETA